MDSKVVKAAHECVERIKEIRQKSDVSLKKRKEIMRFSNSWAMRQAASVSFLTTREELELYCSALISAARKMKELSSQGKAVEP